MRLFLICVALVLPNFIFGQVDFESLLKKNIKGSVPAISVKELKANYTKYVLLDCREPQEYVVSHLKGAHNIGFIAFKGRLPIKTPKNTHIVVYCTIGARSEIIGERLQQLGYKNVKNLYGSIFEWVNQGNAVYDKQNKVTNNVHTYDLEWSKWLLKGNKVF